MKLNGVWDIIFSSVDLLVITTLWHTYSLCIPSFYTKDGIKLSNNGDLLVWHCSPAFSTNGLWELHPVFEAIPRLEILLGLTHWQKSSNMHLSQWRYWWGSQKYIDAQHFWTNFFGLRTNYQLAFQSASIPTWRKPEAHKRYDSWWHDSVLP